MPTDGVLPNIQQFPTQNPSTYDTGSDRLVLDVLRSEHILSTAQYEDIKVRMINENASAETVIKSLNIISEKQLAQAKARALGVPFVSLSETTFSPATLSLIPKSVAQRFQLIPFLHDEKTKTMSVAMTNPVDLEAIAFIRQKTGYIVNVYAAVPSEVAGAISQQYQQEIIGEVGQALKETEDLTKKKEGTTAKVEKTEEEAPIAKIVSTILEYAVQSKASDVHIEPLEDKVRVRYRIDGILYDKLSLPKTVQEAVISRIKILSEMKIDEHRIPQDGRFNFKVGKEEVDLRVSIIPKTFGEKIVLRLLQKSGGIPTLPALGLTGTSLKNLETAMLRPHGIIIVCGPTGSGKTTTLYAVLSRLNTSRVNIVSLEDPVEYEIPGVNQVQVNAAVGLTFASGLRSFLRQDPNIILVGEIRDRETTDLALQAALTGHLVFSTLHTSDAASALPRLLDLGAERFLLASTMNALVGQRIVRKLCNHCKEHYAPPPSLISEIKAGLGRLFPQNVDNNVVLYRAKGCSDCGDSGYIGRIGIFEVLTVSDKIGRIVLENPDSATIEKEAILEGMITMKQDGYLKVLAGLTTIEEVLRVAQE